MFPLKNKRLWRHLVTPRLYKLLKEPPCSSPVGRPPLVGRWFQNPPRPADPLTESPHHSTSSGELPPELLYTIQQMVTTAVREQIAILFPAYTVTPSNMDVPNKEDRRVPPAPLPLYHRSQEVRGPSHIPKRASPLNGLHALSAFRRASKTSSTKLHKEHPRRSNRVSLSVKKSWQTTSPSTGRSPTCWSTIEPRIHMSTSPTLRILPFSIVTPLGSSVAYS
ncbi:UNVERIFIED_CONTAM: hypothetical protein Sradi_0730600, partial [Sesamum radiatum]